MVLFILFYFFFRKRRWKEGIFAIIFLMLPLLFLFAFFTPSQLIEGIILRQGHRGFDVYSKASILLFIASSFIYLFVIRKWNIKNEKILYMVAWIILVLLPMMLQGRTSQHHFVYISYPLAILSAIAIKDGYSRKKKYLFLFAAVNIFIAAFFVITAPHDLAYDVAGEVKNITSKQDFIISGNPIVNVIASRDSPPNLTNLAKYHYPETTLNDLIYWMGRNETKVVVLYYHLYEIEGLKEYLQKSPQWQFYGEIEGRGQILFNGITPRFSKDVYEIYVKV